MVRRWLVAAVAVAAAVMIAGAQEPAGGDAKQFKGKGKGKGKAAPIVEEPTMWIKDGVPRLKMEDHLKGRRPMVDPKATVTTPRITP